MTKRKLDSFIVSDLCQPCEFHKDKHSRWRCFCNKLASRCNEPVCKEYGLKHGIKVGLELCEHDRRRSQCKDCGGSEICEHKRQRSQCKDCGGGSICEHKRHRSICKDCGGSQICEHGKRRNICSICDPCGYNIHLRRCRRRKALKSQNPTHAIDDLCMTAKEWDVYLHKLFEDRYGRPKTENDKVQIDEIIPCSGWNLPDDNKYCWHYLNSQWLIDNTNQEKWATYIEEDKQAMIKRIDEWFQQ